MPINKETCFVIMPFSKTTTKHTKPYWKQHFETFLKPLIEENENLEAKRSEALRGDILTQIITDLASSRVMVADLTDHNCNVFWELGVRHSFKHGTVTIAEVNTPLPFDIASTGTLFYDPKNHLQIQEFRKDFKQAIDDCLSNPDRPDSHVLETLSGRGTLFEIFRRDEAVRRLKAVEATCDRNLFIWETIVKRARSNKQKPEDRRFVADRFRSASLELLATNRYVEEDESFYMHADSILGLYTAANGALDVWQISPERMETWFLGQEQSHTKRITDFRKAVETVRAKLQSSP